MTLNSSSKYCGANLSCSGTASPAGCGWDCGTRGPGRRGPRRWVRCVGRGRWPTSSPGPAGCVGWRTSSSCLQNRDRAVSEGGASRVTGTSEEVRSESVCLLPSILHRLFTMAAAHRTLETRAKQCRPRENKVTQERDVLLLINSSEIQQRRSFSFSGKKLKRLDTLINW